MTKDEARVQASYGLCVNAVAALDPGDSVIVERNSEGIYGVRAIPLHYELREVPLAEQRYDPLG